MDVERIADYIGTLREAAAIVLDEIDTTAFTDRYGGTMKAVTPATQSVRAAE